MAARAEIPEIRWSQAFEEVCRTFGIPSLLPEQEQAIRAFFRGKVFVNLPTGYGKSLIYQCLPMVADSIFGKPRGSSLILVISPLKSLMEDQVAYLNSIGVPAIVLGDSDDPEIFQQVLNGCYIVVFSSPECLLITSKWRGMFSSCDDFKDMMIGVAIDEAHCITQWYVSLGQLNFMFRYRYFQPLRFFCKVGIFFQSKPVYDGSSGGLHIVSEKTIFIIITPKTIFPVPVCKF